MTSNVSFFTTFINRNKHNGNNFDGFNNLTFEEKKLTAISYLF